MKFIYSKIIIFFNFKLEAKLKEIWHKYRKTPFIFKDIYGNFYYQTSKDNLYFNFARKGVCDSTNVVNYIIKNIKKDWICVDIGACIGAISVPMWHKTGNNGKVYSIEADPNNILNIKRNLLINNLSDSLVFNYAICNTNKPIQLNIIKDSNGWQSICERKIEKYPSIKKPKNLKINNILVPGETLDAFCINNGIKKINLLKVDVEGAEMDVFLGAIGLFSNLAIDFVIFEISSMMLEWSEKNELEIFEYFKKINYKLFKILKNGNVEELKSGWIRNESGDCIAISPRIKI
ncbi:FkbM family methyltransferase [Patescibacteria group bacterium]|nr:FkbM family methyltransferase [Patescibacteria group bacterium]